MGLELTDPFLDVCLGRRGKLSSTYTTLIFIFHAAKDLSSDVLPPEGLQTKGSETLKLWLYIYIFLLYVTIHSKKVTSTILSVCLSILI